ncbi:MAG: hypothetical protein AAFX92_22305 [Pseudomonadota bacterium]
MPTDNKKFADLGWPKTVWAIGAVHGEVDRLAALHDFILPRFQLGDRLVYLGNTIGRGPAPLATIDEILSFRRRMLSQAGMLVSDIVFLRGAQEEMWQKLLQLQFAPNPQEVLRWMLGQGVDKTLEAYGGKPEEGLAAAREGPLQLTRWTNRLRESIRRSPGHSALFTVLKRAAYTTPNARDAEAPMLLVSAGIDINRPLATQGDSFWWGASDFGKINGGYENFACLVRGLSENGRDVQASEHTISLDGGAARGGCIAAAQLTASGGVIDLFEI